MHGVDEGRVQLWVDALRSGEYRQAEGWLETPVDGGTGNCCLGVAQHVALKNGWVPNETEEMLDWGQSCMNVGAAMWFGFDDMSVDPQLVEVYVHGEYEDLVMEPLFCVAANDDHHWSFDQIAQALEDRYVTGVEVTGV
jgi:hypothetical protein